METIELLLAKLIPEWNSHGSAQSLYILIDQAMVDNKRRSQYSREEDHCI